MSKRAATGNRMTIVTLFVLVFIALAGVLSVGIAVNKQTTTKELGVLSYEVGGLSETDGTEVDNDYRLRTNFKAADKFEKIEIAEDATITYSVFYYNAEKKLIGKTEDLKEDKTNLPLTQTVEDKAEEVKYFRVVIKANEEKEKITFFNKGDYTKQLTVTLSK